jgi:hypothetical protein
LLIANDGGLGCDYHGQRISLQNNNVS